MKKENIFIKRDEKGRFMKGCDFWNKVKIR